MSKNQLGKSLVEDRKFEIERNRLMRWRSNHDAGERLPEKLWKKFAELAFEYGVSKTATRLGVNYYSLAKRMNTRESEKINFIEYDRRNDIAINEWKFELDHLSGHKLRMECRGSSPIELVEVIFNRIGGVL